MVGPRLVTLELLLGSKVSMARSLITRARNGVPLLRRRFVSGMSKTRAVRMESS